MARASEALRIQLETEIAEGRLAPGVALDESSLARRFQVSRTPAREALIQLAAAGLVKLRPRQGAVVAALGAEEAFAMVETLAALESEAAALAAARMTAAETEALVARNAEGADPAVHDDPRRYEAYNKAFHLLIHDGARNPYLAGMIADTRRRLAGLFRASLGRPARVRAGRRQHDLVVEEILAGDPTRARRAMRDHILNGGQVYADLVSCLPSRTDASED